MCVHDACGFLFQICVVVNDEDTGKEARQDCAGPTVMYCVVHYVGPPA